MLEWGIVGTGFISRTVVEAVDASEGSRVRAAAGKAVLSEKSLTTTMAEAEALRHAVTAAGTFFVEGRCISPIRCIDGSSMCWPTAGSASSIR